MLTTISSIGSFAVFCCGDRIAQQRCCVLASVDGDDLHAGTEAGLVGNGAHEHVVDVAVGGYVDAQGPPGLRVAGCGFARLNERAGSVGVDDLVAAVFDASQGSMGRFGGEPVVEESCPVVGRNGVQVGDHVVEGIGNDFRRSVAADAFKARAEIVEALLVFGELADDGIGFKPDQRPLLVVVDTAPPVVPLRARVVQNLRGDGGVLEVAPGAAGAVIERSGRCSQGGPEFVGRFPCRCARRAPRRDTG